MAVYVIQNATTKSLKIGSTGNLAKRLAALQVANEHELLLLCSVAGGQKLEYAIHAELRSSLIRGEWFRNSAEVMAVVRRMMASCLADAGDTPAGVAEIAAHDATIRLDAESGGEIQNAIIRHLREAGLSGAYIGEIALATGHKQGSIRQTANRMRQMGLVRKRSPRLWVLSPSMLATR